MMNFARSITTGLTLLLIVFLAVWVVAAAPQTAGSDGIAPKGQPLTWTAGSQGSEARSEAADTSPIALSDSDGQELTLEQLDVRAAVHGMLSLTELEFRFRNPKPRLIEGRFTCTLPADAAISRFAKEVNGQLMEGEVVDRLRANQVYEQFLHRMRDPALLEQDQGNRFSARIFPIPPNAPVRLVLSYTALLPMRAGVRTYTLPLRGMPKVNHFTFRAVVTPLEGEEAVGNTTASAAIDAPSGLSHSTADVLTMDETDFVASHDLSLSWRASDAAHSSVLRAGDFYVASFRPPDVRPASTSESHDWLFFFDTSASSAEGARHRIHALEALLRALPAGDRVEVMAFDQDVASAARGTAAEVASSIGSRLQERLFLGGTDVAMLLRRIAGEARAQQSRNLVVVSDLVATLGDTDRHALSSLVNAIPAGTRVDALILGARHDAAMARMLTSGRGRVLHVPFSDSLETKAADAAAELRRPLGVSLDAADSAAEWVYPQHIDDVQRGDEVLVMGRLKTGAEPQIALNRGARSEGVVRTASLASATFAPLLEREAYRAYLAYLADREANEPSEAVRQALNNEQVRISVAQRVVIPQTTMLVLESEWDYQRFGLDRRALAAILTVGPAGIERLDRHNLQPVAVVPVMKSAPVGTAQPVDLQRRESTPNRDADPISRMAELAPPPQRNGVAQVASPANMPPSSIAATSEAITVTAAAVDAAAPGEPAPLRGGTIGGVVGGVVGGVQGGVEGRSVRQDTAPRVAPPPPPPAAVVPPAARVTASQSDASWASTRPPDESRVAELRDAIEKDPQDRELYNQLSDALTARGEWTALRTLALRWQSYDPENPQVYEVLALSDESLGNETEAQRAAASLIEVAPAKPELLQRAGLLLVRAHKAVLAETPLRRALELRPDRVNSYRHLALMLWLDGRVEEAARVLESATQQRFPMWYGNVQRVISEELGYVYRAWIAKEPGRRAEIVARARDHNVDLERHDALRVTLAWETDANDVDLHVIDPGGEECYYQHKLNGSGLELYEDITQGLGPEVVRAPRVEKGRYEIGVRYFAAGPMGVSRGIVVVMRDDGRKQPSIEIYPFRLMQGGGAIRRVATVSVK